MSRTVPRALRNKNSMALTVAAILSQSEQRLTAVTETPRLEAEMLLAHAMKISRAFLLARLREPFDAPDFEALMSRRLAHEPLAYIFGEWEFFGLSMLVSPPLLTPRPETEHLVERALAFLSEQPGPCTVIDTCCGTGCVAVSIARSAQGHRVYASDIRLDAVEMAQQNAARHKVNVCCVQADLLSPFAGPVDMITANPPYVPEREWADLSPVITRHEDPGALLAGADGLDVIRRLVPEAAGCLRPGGMLALEIGESQYAAVEALFLAHGFDSVQCDQDLAGIKRIISGVRTRQT